MRSSAFSLAGKLATGVAVCCVASSTFAQLQQPRGVQPANGQPNGQPANAPPNYAQPATRQPANAAPQAGLRQPSGVVQTGGTEQTPGARPTVPNNFPNLNAVNPNGQNANAPQLRVAGQPLNVIPQGGAQPRNAVQPPQVQQAQLQVLANGQQAQPQVLNIAPPFQLSPQQEEGLNKLLTDWEKQSDKIQRFECNFVRYEYDPAIAPGNDPNIPTTESRGEIKYAAPDKGLFRVAETKVPDPKTGKMEKSQLDLNEYWTCDGDSIYTVDHKQKLVIQTPLPAAMRGKAITEGPLPFVFGAKAAALKSRYYMRVITPPERAKTEVWLEAFPRMQKDAANFSRVELILSLPNLQPVGLLIYNPSANADNKSRTTILLQNASVNSQTMWIASWFTNFAAPKPPGFKLVKQANQGVGPPPPAGPVANGQPGAAPKGAPAAAQKGVTPPAQAQKTVEPRR